MRKVKRLPKGSAHVGKLPRGCVACEKGGKLVLLVTGKCGRSCCYCPLSYEKRGKDVFFANEKRIDHISAAIEEAELMDALGTGITGGDPLLEIGRTVGSIGLLKERFGSDHHIHLYTSTTDPKRIEMVAEAGLDEIRFHPPMELWSNLGRSKFSKALSFSKELGMSVGLELPVIPGKEKDLKAAIAFSDESELDFVNLNELEFSETNWLSLRKLGFDVKDDVSSGVKGSQQLALKLLKMDCEVPLHYCSASFKDAVQLRRRIMRRGRNVRKPHEILTDDGTLVKGVIETSHPAATAAWLMKEFEIPGRLVWSDREKNRLEIAPWVLEEIAGNVNLPCYIVEEYPTADRLEVERTPLKRR